MHRKVVGMLTEDNNMSLWIVVWDLLKVSPNTETEYFFRTATLSKTVLIKFMMYNVSGGSAYTLYCAMEMPCVGELLLTGTIVYITFLLEQLCVVAMSLYQSLQM